MKRYLLFNPLDKNKNIIENEISNIIETAGISIKKEHDLLKTLKTDKANEEYNNYLKFHKMTKDEYGSFCWYDYNELKEITKNRCFMKIYEEQLDCIQMFKSIYEKIYKPEYGVRKVGELLLDKIKNIKDYELIEMTRNDLKEYSKKLLKTSQIKKKGIKP